MKWRGKAIGGSIGSVFGAPGALIGAAAGHYLVDRKKQPAQKQRERILALVAGTMHQLTMSNNRFNSITANTVRLIVADANKMLGHLMPVYSLDCLIEQSAHIPKAISKLAQAVRPFPELAQVTAAWCWRQANCDGPPAGATLNILNTFAGDAGLKPDQAVQAALLYYRGAAGISNSDEERREACTLLGVAYSATSDEIKQAFRKQSLKYHPDKHGNLDPDIRQLAAERFTQIKAAYDCLMSTSPFVGELYVQPADRSGIQRAIPGGIANCFVCRTPHRLPEEPSAIDTIHCQVCQALLAFERPLAEHLTTHAPSGF